MGAFGYDLMDICVAMRLGRQGEGGGSHAWTHGVEESVACPVGDAHEECLALSSSCPPSRQTLPTVPRDTPAADAASIAQRLLACMRRLLTSLPLYSTSLSPSPSGRLEPRSSYRGSSKPEC